MFFAGLQIKRLFGEQYIFEVWNDKKSTIKPRNSVSQTPKNSGLSR